MSEKQRFKTVSVVLLDQATAHSTPGIRNGAADDPIHRFHNRFSQSWIRILVVESVY